MSSKKSTSVCLVCLTRFKESGGICNQPYRYQHRLLHSVRESLNDPDDGGGFGTSGGNGVTTVGTPNGVAGLYTKFLHFTSRHLTLKGITAPLLESSKECNDGSGEGPCVFCDNCSDLISHVCDLYAELQIVQLHLIWKLSEVGRKLRDLKTSGKARKGLVKSLADQLNIKEVKSLEIFRKALKIKCTQNGKGNCPKPLIHRGLFPEQWKYPYSATRTTLMNLIVVFLLWSPSMYLKREQTVNEDVRISRKRVGRGRGPRQNKVFKRNNLGSPLTGDAFIKEELSNRDMDCDDDGEDGHFSTFESNDDGDDLYWPRSSASSTSTNHATDADSSNSSWDSATVPRSALRRKRKIAQKNIKTNAVDKKKNIQRSPNKGNSHRKKPRHLIRAKGSDNARRLYTCSICQQEIQGRIQMINHLTSSHETSEKSYQCWFCPMKFTLLQTLELHRLDIRVAKHYGGRNMFRCEESNCNEEFWELEKYEEHLKGHIADGGTRNAVNSTVEIQLHDGTENMFAVKTSTPEENLLNVATHSSAFFSREDGKESVPEPSISVSDRSPANEPPKKTILYCPKCNWCFLNPDLLERHEDVHFFRLSRARVRPKSKRTLTLYTCTICHQNTKGPRSMIEHLKSVHETLEKSYYCWFCPKKFTILQSLELHRLGPNHRDRNIFMCENSNCNENFWELKNTKNI